MKEIYAKLDEKNAEYETKFPESDGIVRKSYCTYCGGLTSGGGAYGWFDVDNLPDYCSGGHITKGEEEYKSTTKKKDKDTSSDNSEATQAQNSESTAPAETQPPTQAPVTEAPVVQPEIPVQ